MTERLQFHFSLSCTGGGNGNPLQCSCLENPRDSGASWTAVYGVAQSWTRLKRLSSSSSNLIPGLEEKLEKGWNDSYMVRRVADNLVSWGKNDIPCLSTKTTFCSLKQHIW